MKKGLNRKKQYGFPEEKEIEKVIKRITQLNYNRINIGLRPNANETDREKYNICQSISKYKRKNNLSEKELKGKMEINQEKLEDILFGRISKLDLENLAYLIDNLKTEIIEKDENFLLIAPPFYAVRSSLITKNKENL